MARDLEITVNVDGTQAKRELGAVDTSVQKIGQSAQVTTRATDSLVTSILKISTGVGLERFAEQATTKLIAFVASTFEAADALQRMHDKTGINVEALQRIQIAGDEVGNTLEQLTAAINMMQRRIAGDDTSAVNALRQLGINVLAFKALNTEQQFNAISEALRRIQDPAEQVRIAIALFGRQGAEILPTLKRGMEDLGEGTIVMSKKSVDALDRAGDAWTRFWRASKGVTGNIVGGTIDALFPDEETRRIRRGGMPNIPGAPGVTLPTTSVEMGASELQTAYRYLASDLSKFNEEQRKAEAAAKHLHETERRELEATIRSMQEFEAEGVRAAQAIGHSLGGMPVLRDLGIAMGSIQLGGARPTVGNVGSLMPDLSGQAAKHMEGLTGGSFFGNILGNVKGALDPKAILNSMIGGGLSGLVSTGLGLAVKGIGALFHMGGPSQQEVQGRDVEKQFEQAMGGWQGIQKALIDTGMTADQVNSKISQLFAAEKQGGDAVKRVIDDINGALNAQKQDEADLAVAVQKYGFTFEELGSKMRKQQLDDQAKTLLNDWRLLVDSGIQIGTVNERMAASINDYLHLALQTGQEVPAAMRPIVDQLRTQGLLTDDLKDANITWSETMTQGFDRVVAKLDELLQRMGLIPQKAADAARAIDDIPNGFGDFDHGLDRQVMHRGGTVLPFVTRAHRGLAIDEVPIIAQTGEGILSRGAMRRIGGAGALNRLNAGGSTGAGVVNHVTVVVDGDLNSPAARRKVARDTMDALQGRLVERRLGAAR